MGVGQAATDHLSFLFSQVILIGGTCKNPTIGDKLASLFPESTQISSQIDADQVIARGCALQAAAISKLSGDEASYISSTSSLSDPIISSQKATSKPIGLLVPAPTSNGASTSPAIVDGKIFVTVIEANTPLPARRIVELPYAKDASNVKIPIYEGSEEVHVEAPPAAEKKASNGDAGSDDDYSDDEEEEETRTAYVKPTTQLANVVVPVKGAGTVRVTIIVDKEGKTQIEAGQTGSSEVQKVDL